LWYRRRDIRGVRLVRGIKVVASIAQAPYDQKLATRPGDVLPLGKRSMQLVSCHLSPRSRIRRLRVLLRAPCLSHPVLAASSSSVLASAASQILYTYRMLSARNRLNPSHSQIRRIVTTGHIVLLCRDANEIHQQQATELLGIVNHLLLCHVDSWPEATRLIDAFRAAAAILGECKGKSKLS